MTRRQAGLINLFAFILAAALLAGFSAWLHPGPLFTANGAGKPLLMVIGIGAILGPALMLYLFKPGKKGLMIDVASLVVLQVLIWAGGTWIIWQERPGWLVLTVDRIELVRANEINADKIPDPTLRQPVPGRPTLVLPRQPDDLEMRKKILFASVSGGPDIDRIPELYQRPSPGDRDAVRRAARHDGALPERALSLAEEDNIALLPLVGHGQDMLVALNLADWAIADWWAVDPWQE